jgi:hypothetical protein
MSDDAARQEAERRYPNKSVVYGGALLDDTRIEGFVAGAEWQASRTPVVADVDAIARVLGEHAAIPGSWSCACGLNPLVRTRVTLASHQAEQVAALGITVTGEADRG